MELKNAGIHALSQYVAQAGRSSIVFTISFFNDVPYSVIQWSVAYQFDSLFSKSFKNEAIYILFQRAKNVLQKVNILQTSSPFCTLYYIKWYPNSLFPYFPSLSRPKNCKFGSITVPRNGFYFWYLYKI